MATVKLEGFAELEAALDQLSKAAGKGVLRRSLIKSAEPMAEIARALAPDDTTSSGFDLKRSIKVGTRLSRGEKKAHRKMFRNDKAAVEVFMGAGPLPQAIYTEFGTSPFINKGKLAGTHNPGIRAQPYMRPAWEQDRRAMLSRLSDELWAELSKSIQRAERKASRQARG